MSNNNGNAQVDVLAVLDLAACRERDASMPDGVQIAARAAVAELIERERMAREALEGFRDSGPSGGQNFREWHQSYSGAVAKAQAYFDRIRGAA